MKQYIAAAAAGMALVCSTVAHAESWFDFEAGLGGSVAQKAGDGLWYWASMAHHTPNDSIAGRAGIQINLIDAKPRSWIPGLRAHLTYGYFGHLHWTSKAGEDAQPGDTMGFDPQTGGCYNNNCGAVREFDSTGDMMAVSLTLEPFWNLGSGWTVGVEGGPALYRYTWTSYATNLQNTDGVFGPGYSLAGQVQTFHHNPHWYLGALVGASIGYKNISLRYNYLYSPTQWEDGVPSGVKGVHMVTINVTF
jgi:hypothetical protein